MHSEKTEIINEKMSYITSMMRILSHSGMKNKLDKEFETFFGNFYTRSHRFSRRKSIIHCLLLLIYDIIKVKEYLDFFYRKLSDLIEIIVNQGLKMFLLKKLKYFTTR